MKAYLFNRGRDTNIGDSLISDVISRSLKAKGYNVETSPNYLELNGKLGALKVHLRSYLSDACNIFKSDIIIIGGGNLIMDTPAIGARWAIHHFWLSILSLIFRKRYYYLCIGATPLNIPVAQILYRFALKYAHRISVRDSFSLSYLQRFTGRQDICLMFDPVLLLPSFFPIVPKHTSNSIEIGLCPVQLYPKICKDVNIYQKYIELHVKLIKYFASNNGNVFLFLNDPMSDKRVFQDILHEIPCSLANFYTRESFTSLEDYLIFIGNLDFLISSRMHAIITATSYGVPSVGFGWQPKMKYFYLDQGLDGHIDIIAKFHNGATADDAFQETLQFYEKLRNKPLFRFSKTLDLQEFLDMGSEAR